MKNPAYRRRQERLERKRIWAQRRFVISRVVMPVVTVSTLILLAFVGVQPFATYKEYIRRDLFPTDQEIEEAIFKEINDYRAYEEVPLYTREPLMDELAKEHCLWLQSQNFRAKWRETVGPSPSYPTVTGWVSTEAHVGFEERAERIRAEFGPRPVSEGIAFGDRADEIVNSWLRSITHANLISSEHWRRAGLAYIDGYACLIVSE
jgi:uncharacterized protein YkwD